jgi:hypothetical protein
MDDFDGEIHGELIDRSEEKDPLSFRKASILAASFRMSADSQ